MRKVYKTPAGTVPGLYADMLRQPHLLVAGATGSGKSVVVNGLIYNLLYRPPGDGPQGVQLVLIDPKRVELAAYRQLPHTIRTATEPEKIRAALIETLRICENRYAQMQRDKLRKWRGGDLYLVIDEFADLMTTQRAAVLPLVQRIAQIGRAAKIHIILATQTPIAKVLPTEIKCNFDARLALRTRSAQDSRNILGVSGCETFPRYGVGRYVTPERDALVEIPFYSDSELAARVEWWTKQNGFNGFFKRLRL